MTDILKSESFGVVLNSDYDVDNTTSEITADLPNPASNDWSGAWIANNSDYPVLLGSYPVEGATGFKIMPGDLVQLIIVKGTYRLTKSSGYIVSSDGKQYKHTVDGSTGQPIYTHINI